MPQKNQPMSPPMSPPISPHLQVYAFKLHMAISIFHRITGVVLAFGVVALIYWLAAAAYGPESFARAQGVFGSWFGYLCLFGWSVCLFYHLCNGVRHLFWDIGWGFEPKQVTATSRMVLVGTVVLTALSWAIGLSV